MLKIIILFLISFVVYAAEKIESPKPSWATFTSKDEMTGKLSAYAFSRTVSPSKRMSFPYGDVTSWMGVGCEGESEWAYFGFSSAPNLTNDVTESGYNSISTRIKWNNQVEKASLTQEWGSRAIHFRDGASAISNMSASNTVLLELRWHGQQPVYFEYSLSGSSEAIAEIRAKCSVTARLDKAAARQKARLDKAAARQKEMCPSCY